MRSSLITIHIVLTTFHRPSLTLFHLITSNPYASKIPKPTPTSTLDKTKLLTVKSKRNDLAHGIFSFKECGKDYGFQDLYEIKIHVVEYLRQILNNIENYINQKDHMEI